MLLKAKFLATKTKYLRKPTLRLVPLFFFRVVAIVTIGVGLVFRWSSYFRNLWEIEKSCVECSWSDPKNMTA